MDGGRIYYEVEGDGHPLLLIHCGLADLRQWDQHIPPFAKENRVIRYDTRGYGRTETDDVEFANVADAIAVLDHVGAETACVVGHSRGGMIGLDLVLKRPERVAAFVSLASGIGGYKPEVPPGAEPPPWAEMERLWEAKEWEGLSEIETRVWVDGWGQPSTRVDPEIRRTVHDWILATYRQEKSEGKPRAMKPPAVERLGEVRCPTLVMVGLVDEPGGVSAGRHLSKSVAGARLEEFPGAAHMINLEQPKRFGELVLEFVADVHRRA